MFCASVVVSVLIDVQEEVFDSCGFVNCTSTTTNKVHKLHKDDLTTVSIGVLADLIGLHNCLYCGEKLEVVAIEGNTSLSASLWCEGCEEEYHWEASNKLGANISKNTLEDTAREVVGSILAGITYSKYFESRVLAGQRHVSKGAYMRWETKVGEIVEELLSNSEAGYRKKIGDKSGNEFKVAIDCRWSSRGFNAEEGTVVCCDLKTGAILYHAHLMRTRTGEVDGKF